MSDMMTDHRGDDDFSHYQGGHNLTNVEVQVLQQKAKEEANKMRKPQGKSQPTVKTADLAASLAANLFAALNPMEVEYMRYHPFNQMALPTAGVIITDANPEDLYYPEGWYFAKGNFRNKHNTTSGKYEEIPMLKHDGTPW